jgi:hypothetical protein
MSEEFPDSMDEETAPPFMWFHEEVAQTVPASKQYDINNFLVKI